MAEDTDDEFPAWGEPATKGDLVRSLAYISTTIGALGIAVTSMQNNDNVAALEALKKYLSESQDLQKLLNEIGGRNRDGN